MEMFSGLLLLRVSGMEGVLKVADFFYCACLVGCVFLFFVKWLFGFCLIHVVCVWCVVVVDVFWGLCVCI